MIRYNKLIMILSSDLLLVMRYRSSVFIDQQN